MVDWMVGQKVARTAALMAVMTAEYSAAWKVVPRVLSKVVPMADKKAAHLALS